MTTSYPLEWDVRDRENEEPDWSDPDIEALATSYEMGLRDYARGRTLEMNPFLGGLNPEAVTNHAREWHHGWRDAEQADKETL